MALQEHLLAPRGRGALADAPYAGAAGGSACGDLVRIAVRVEGNRVVEAGFDTTGCAPVSAAASAVVELVEGESFLDAARLTADHVAGELGGLLPAAHHAAELSADALHRALGAAARDGAPLLDPDPGRTLVAMSGGVDSAAAAQLALDAGDDVVAVTLELWSDPATDSEKSCCSPRAVTGARDLAHRMGMPHVTLDLRERFRAAVVDPFVTGYADGLTPNPCVRCNGEVRFDAMLALAGTLGAARLATGHYARIERDVHGLLIRAGADPAKDQAYMLARLEPRWLDHLSFPLGGLTKDTVRSLARDAGLPVADKRESQDLCFAAGLGARGFLRRHGPPTLRRPGPIVDRQGTELGRHDGQHGFTVGQRRGIGLAGPEPLYVLAKDARSATVTVGPRAALRVDRVRLEGPRLHRGAAAVTRTRLRHGAASLACRALEDADGGVELVLDEPAEAVAPGQLACLMAGDVVVGHGTIAASA